MSSRLTRVFVVIGLLLVAGNAIGASPVRAQADPATPVAGSVSALEEMLAFAPDVLSGTEGPQFQIASFADAAAQLAAVGVTAPEDGSDEEAIRAWISAVIWVLFPDFIAPRNAEWRGVFGFDLFQVDQALTLGEPPATIAIMRGRFDQDAIAAALTTAGYQTVDSADATIYSLDPEARVVFDSEVGQLALARMNNVAILPNGTLICASRLDLVQSVIGVVTGRVPALMDRPEVQSLVRAQNEPLASALLLTGNALVGEAIDPGSLLSGTPPSVDTIASRVAETSKMPPILLGLLGTTAGGPLFSASGDSEEAMASDIPAARFDINLLMTDTASAETAVEIATERLETAFSVATGEPYADFFSDWTGEAISGTTVARLELTYADGVPPGRWLNMLFQRDLLFVAW